MTRRRPPTPPEPPEPPDESSPESSASLPARTVTFPPSAWDRDDDVISSARRDGDRARPDPPPGGPLETHLTEAEARRLLDARFTAAGVQLIADYTFRDTDLVVKLDAYDPRRKIGYAYVSHADADVVTDFDAAAEVAFQQLAAEARAFVLVVHDADVPTADALEHRIDAFFEQIRRLAP